MLHEMIGINWCNHLYLCDTETFAYRTDADIYLKTLGLFQSRGNFRYSQKSSGVVLHVIEEGRGVFQTEHGSFEARAGDQFCFFTDQNITYWDEKQSPWKYQWLGLEGNRCKGLIAQAGFTPRTPLLSKNLSPGFRQLAEAVMSEFTKPRASFFKAAEFAWRLLGLLDDQDDTKKAPPTLAQRARTLIENSYDHFFSVTELAEHLGVSRVTLFRAFREQGLENPKHYIEKHRMEQAKTLLLHHPELSIKQVADRIGFSSSNYFCRYFRIAMGASPDLWRKTH